MFTRRGWVRAGDVVVGDELIGSNGQWTNVLGVFPQGEVDLFEVNFGSASIRTCAEHRWLVREMYGYQPTVKTTGQLMRSIAEGQQWGIPVIGSVTRRFMHSITPAGRGRATCFTVDAPDHLFAAGRDFIVTHNTECILHGFDWLLDQWPGLNIGYCSYNATIAASKSKRARDLAISSGIRLTSSATSDWRLPEGGGVFATGIGGTATGYGFDLGVVDDPFKNRQEAESATRRQHAWDWFTDVFLKRLSPNASVIVCMARWHPDDLAGRCIERLGWPYIRLPAISEVNGEERALWPEQWSLEAMQRRRRESGVYTWESLEQGNPRPRGGSVFNEPTYYDESALPERYNIGGGTDLAYTKRTSSDWSAAAIMHADVTSELVYVRNVLRVQEAAPKFAQRLKRLSQENGNVTFRWYAAGTEIGSADFMKDDGVPLDVLPPLGDKFTRSIAYAAAWNDKRILLPTVDVPHSESGDRLTLPDEDWVSQFVLEHSLFTGVDDEHDDQIDAATACFDSLKGTSGALSRLEALSAW